MSVTICTIGSFPNDYPNPTIITDNIYNEIYRASGCHHCNYPNYENKWIAVISHYVPYSDILDLIKKSEDEEKIEGEEEVESDSDGPPIFEGPKTLEETRALERSKSSGNIITPTKPKKPSNERNLMYANVLTDLDQENQYTEYSTYSNFLIRKKLLNQCYFRAVTYMIPKFRDDLGTTCEAITRPEPLMREITKDNEFMIILKSALFYGKCKIIKSLVSSEFSPNQDVSDYIRNIFIDRRMTLRQWQQYDMPPEEIVINMLRRDCVKTTAGTHHKFGAILVKEYDYALPNKIHDRLALSCFSTMGCERRSDIERNRKFFEKNLRKNRIINKYVPMETYISILGRYKFNMSPEAYQEDSLRNYETLLAGVIPVIEKNEFVEKIYYGCPILWTIDFSEITEEYLIKKYNEMIDKTYDFTALYLSWNTDYEIYLKYMRFRFYGSIMDVYGYN